MRAAVLAMIVLARSSVARVRRILFSLDKRLTWKSPMLRLARAPLEEIIPSWSLKTGQWHWRDQLKALLPQRGLGRHFSFRSLLTYMRTKRGHAGNASLAGI
jgi:hypothetical protein